MRLAAWALDTDEREGPQQSFLEEIRTTHTVPSFRSTEDLHRQVGDRLRTIAAEDLAPWVKLDSIVFRAVEVIQRGSSITVKARVHSEEVAHALKELRPGAYGRGESLRLTWAGRSQYGRINNVECTTTTARSKFIVIEIETTEAARDYLTEMSFNNLSADDVTDITLRAALIRERHPALERNRGFIPEMPDPLNALRSAAVPDEIVRPLAELIIVDALVGTGRAARIDNFRLGTSIGGKRRLQFAWVPPRRYSNEKRQQPRQVSGEVQL